MSDSQVKTVSVGIPVYYNEQSLPELASRLIEVDRKLATQGAQLELILVDDGSGDGSYSELLQIQRRFQRTTVCKHTRNFGALVALKTALANATGDCLVILSADLQDPPELIEEMVAKWKAGRKYVICQRRRREDPWTTRIFAAVYYWLVRKLIAKDYPVGGFDFSLMDRQMMELVREAPKNVNFVVFCYWLGFKPYLLRYDRAERVYGKSRWTLLKKLKLATDTFLGFSAAPIRLISSIGLVVSITSFGYGIFEIIAALAGFVVVKGFASLVVLITFLLGLIIFFLGVIAEYLWRILYEVNRLPEGVTDHVSRWRGTRDTHS
ncbi:MAG: glycosyltransferase family 2 protein [Dokdonella sp.]